MNTSALITLAKSATGLILNQKNVAFFEESKYEEGNSYLAKVGIDTNTIAGGLFSGDTKEILTGGKSGLDNSLADGAVSFVFNNSIENADSSVESKLFEHPLEYNGNLADSSKGAVNYIAEHSIQQPQTFKCTMYLPPLFYTSVMNEVDELNRKKTLIRIVTKGKTFKNMVIMKYEKSLSADKLYRMPIVLHFREIQARYPLEDVSGHETDRLGGSSL